MKFLLVQVSLIALQVFPYILVLLPDGGGGGKSHLECFTLCIFFILGMLSSVICLKK